VTAVEEAVIFPVFEGGGEIKDVQSACQAFYRIVEIGCRFGVVEYHQVVPFLKRRVAEKTGTKELGCASMEGANEKTLGLGHRNPVHQRCKAVVIRVSI
jgi:hypothetical protein